MKESAIVKDKGYAGGKACLRGTRFTMEQLLAEIRESSVEEVCEEYELDKKLVSRALIEVAMDNIIYIKSRAGDIGFD